MTQMLRENLLSVGCPEASVQAIEQLYSVGALDDAVRQMRFVRCELMDELHRSQRRVDCLDYLIRQTEKEIRMTERRK